MAKSATMTKCLGGYFTEWCSRKPELPALVYMEDSKFRQLNLWFAKTSFAFSLSGCWEIA